MHASGGGASGTAADDGDLVVARPEGLYCPPGAARSNGSSPRASSYAPSEFGASFGPAIPTHAMHLALPMRLGNSSGYCFCNWQPQNGFDGFSTLTALFSLAFSVVLAVAICANVRNPPLRS